MKPTVGRIVHYHNTSPRQGNRPYAAIIVAAEGEQITLSVMAPEGGRFNANLTSTEGQRDVDEAEWWVWPPRE